VVLRDRLSAITATTELARRAGLPLTLSVSPNTVLPARDSSDGTSKYAAALAALDRDRERYVDFSRRGTANDAKRLIALGHLVDAAAHERAAIFDSDPARVISFESPNPAIDSLELLGKCAIRASLLQHESDPDGSRKLADAAFALGARSFEERLTLAQARAGISLMAQGAQLIAANDPTRDAAARSFGESLKSLAVDQLDPLARAIVTVDPGVLAQHSGDVLYIAQSPGERLWRVEAILALGRLRFNAARVGDQREAARVIERLKNDPDPAIRAAAAAAGGLTTEQYRMLGA